MSVELLNANGGQTAPTPTREVLPMLPSRTLIPADAGLTALYLGGAAGRPIPTL